MRAGRLERLGEAKWEDVRGKWRRMHSEELHEWYTYQILLGS
jgi:hypothetical protein